MAIRILTDSTSDILPAEAKRLGLLLVPLKVLFGEQAYRDGVDLSHGEFYEKLIQARELPTTSQPAPGDFLPYFRRAKLAGDTVICVLLSGELSGTVQSALVAKEMAGYGNIHVVDSRQTIVGLRLLVELALRRVREGADAGKIVEELEAARGRVRLYGMVDTLRYLHRGGRVSGAVNIVGTALKMKPIITVQDGKVALIDKARGHSGGLQAVIRHVEQAGGIRPGQPVCYGFAYDSARCTELKRELDRRYRLQATQMYSVGAVIGTHIGPGGMVVAFLEP